MARSKSSKHHILSEIEERLDRSKSVIFASFQGLKVKEAEELRKTCRTQDSECIMAKKTLIRLALKNKGLDEVDAKGLEGEIVAIFGYGDEVTPAKVLARFAKDHEALKLLAGLILSSPAGSRGIDSRAVAQLATLPSREELYAKLVGSLASPLRGMVGVLQGNLRSLVYVLQAVADSKQ